MISYSGPHCQDTIAAIATAPGVGGIAVIRVSGPRALEFSLRTCPSLSRKKIESHRIYYCSLRDPRTAEKVDSVLLSFFEEGRSFTGEEVCEISCHGGALVSRRVLETLISVGARLAEPGEFTARAFLNRRIDLVQAESVLSLIESRTERAANLSLRHLDGLASDQLKKIEDQVQWLLAHFEANIDFSEEDIEVADQAVLKERLVVLRDEVAGLLERSQQSQRVTSGFDVALVGAPNVGKSSFLNRVLGEERSIVSPLAGTTRDFIEAETAIDGYRLKFIDMAGLRETKDELEKIGVSRALKRLKSVDGVCLMSDGPKLNFSVDWGELRDKPVFLVLNKSDLIEDCEQALDQLCFSLEGKVDLKGAAWLSSMTGEGFSHFSDKFLDFMDVGGLGESFGLTNIRQIDLLKKVLSGIEACLNCLEAQSGPEIAVFELQQSLYASMDILGKRFDDQVMDRVFREFCLGK